MANKTLEAKVKLNTTAAEKSLANLTKKINAINSAVNKTNSRNSGLTTAITNANKTAINLEKNMNKVNTANKNAASSARSLQSSYKSSNTAASKLLTTVKSLAATYLGVMGAKAVISASDTITSAENRLNNLSGGSPELTQTSMDKIYAASQRSRSGYGDMLSNVSKSMTLASSSFGDNIDNAIKFQEIMSKAYTVGGASAAEQSSSMYQLIQALGSGTLQGDELRSVREGAPVAYKEIEKFAQGVLNTSDSLKDLASDGLITSDIVVAAIMNAEEQINESFENTQMTFAQSWEIIKNMALQAFKPVLQMLNDALNSDLGQSIINGLGNALVFIANVIIWLGDLLGAFFNWFAQNWYWLQWIVYAVIAALLVYFTIMAAKAVWAGITAFISFLTALSPLYIWIIVIGLIIAALVWLTGSIENACGLIGSIFMVVVAFVYNSFVGLFDGILQLAYALVSPFIGIFEWMLNALNGGFNGFTGALFNGFGQICSWIIDIAKIAAKAIDALLGTDTVGKLNELQNKALNWGKNENAITISREAPTLSSLSNGKFDRWEYTDAAKTGYDWGSSAANWVSDKLSGIGDYLTSYNDANTAVGSSYLPDINTSLSTDDLLGSLDGISSDVSDINDSMDLSNDDLEYLRKIADMEWRNEFTTAEIKVDMTNNNTVSSERDLDGIVEYLSDVLRNEMTNVAYGVHY